MRLLLVVPLAAAWLFAQGAETETKKKEKEKYVKPADRDLEEPGVKIEDSKVARQKVSAFEKEFKAIKNDMKQAELVQTLGQWDHPLILKKAQSLIRSKNRFVAVEAVFVCARQGDGKKVGKTLHGLLKREKRTDIVCGLLVSLGKIGYTTAFKDAESYYRRDTKDTHRAATRYFGFIKSKKAFRLLAEKLDYPRPKDIDDPNNPPASWWAERFKEWELTVPFTKWAINQLVPGETFDSTREAKEWAIANGKKHKIKW